MCFFYFCRAGIDDVETDVVEIEAKLDKVRTVLGKFMINIRHRQTAAWGTYTVKVFNLAHGIWKKF